MIRILCFTFFLSATSSAGVDITREVAAGDYRAAYDVLLRAADTLEMDEDLLFKLCMTAPAGKDISYYLKEYSQKYPNGRNIEIIKQRLCGYYSSQGMDITASKAYTQIPEIDAQNDGEIYKVALCKQRAGEYDSAREIYRSIIKIATGDMQIWALLGLADCDLLSGNIGKAIMTYEDLINLGESSAVFPLALLGISEAYNKSGQKGKAADSYGRYRAVFSQSTEIPELEALISEQVEERPSRVIPGSINVAYYIQVGVFGKKDNGRTCLRKYRNLGYQAKLGEFKEGGQLYFRVIVGPYKDELSARKTKEKLERTQGEKFVIFVQ